MNDPHSAARTPLTSYQKKLFLLLGVATFFEGYEYFALTQVLPSLRAAFSLSEGDAGVLVGFIGFGALLAFVLIRRADVVGRRKVLTVTIAGYTVCSVLCGLAPDVYSFAIAQLLARAFLLAEYAVSMVYLAEEFPADRRGFALGVMQGLNSFGGIVCAGVVPPLLRSPWGFRAVYVVGALPLLLLIYLRRSVRETDRFLAIQSKAAPTPLFAVFRSAYRSRILLLSLIWGLTLVCSYLSVTYWKEFAVRERGLDDTQVSHAVMIAALGSLPLVFASGKLLDLIGRRRGAVVVFLALTGSVLLAYNAHGFVPLTVGLTGSIFAASAVAPVLNTLTLELLPTELRADGYGWANNVLGKLGYVIGPLAVGFTAERYGYGVALSGIALLPLCALALVLSRLPETSGRELEDTSAL